MIADAPQIQQGWFMRHDIPVGWATLLAGLAVAAVTLYGFWRSWKREDVLRAARRINRLSENLNKMGDAVRRNGTITNDEVLALNERMVGCQRDLKKRMFRERFDEMLTILQDSHEVAGRRMSQDSTGEIVWTPDRREWGAEAIFMANHLDEITRSHLINGLGRVRCWLQVLKPFD